MVHPATTIPAVRLLTAMLVLGAVAAGAAQSRPGPTTASGQAAGRAPEALEAVDVVINGKVVRKVTSAAIKKAATRKITRYGQEFDATPFEAVLKLAAIPAGSRVRVVGEEDAMELGSGGEDPASFVVIFNQRGIPVLTPLPDVRPSNPGGAAGATQATLPTPGSRGGSTRFEPPPPGSRESAGAPANPQSAPFVPPPAGSGAAGAAAQAGGAGRGNGSGPGMPAGFGRLNEVRSFTRIEVLD